MVDSVKKLQNTPKVTRYLDSHLQHVSTLVSLPLYQHLILADFLMLAFSGPVVANAGGSILLSPPQEDYQHLLMCSLATCIASWVNVNCCVNFHWIIGPNIYLFIYSFL